VWLSRTRCGFLILFSCFWTLAEYARGIVFTGFPWNLMGYLTDDFPYFSQIASVVGSYGVSFLVVLIAALLTTKKTWMWGVAVCAAVCSYGYIRLHIDGDVIAPTERVSVIAVQPSISQYDKVDRTKHDRNLGRHVALSEFDIDHSGKTLIVWPEAAIDASLTRRGDAMQYIGSLIRSDGVYLVTGADRVDNDGRIYNGAAVLGKGGEVLQTYDKRHLLPFGEFIPEFLLDLGLSKVTPGALNFSSGTSTRTISIDGIEKFNLAICYEIVFPGEVMDDHASKWILNITNDAWFGDSDGPHQHMRSVRFRAIEEGRAVVRVANNGISCVIDCNGGVVDRLETDEVGTLKADMPMPYRDTFYSVHGNKTILLLVIGLILIVLVLERVRIRR
jgi:apolipoprotein N-acyltransferase